MVMRLPPHPGLSVRHDCIEPRGLTITDAAEILGVTRQTLNNLVNGRSGISPEMAIRLDKAFGGGAQTWLQLQMAYDLALAQQDNGINETTDELETEETELNLISIAKNTLTFFTETASEAQALLTMARAPTADVFASINTLTTDRAMRNLISITDERRGELRQLCDEPAIARVVTMNEQGQKQVYFITRATPNQSGKGGVFAASYRAPIGRLASLPVGSDLEVRTPGGPRRLEILERAALRPSQIGGEWDSVNSELEGADYGPLTVVSFLALLRPSRAEGHDLLEALLEEDRATNNIFDGLRRTVITKMALRDRPLLDQYQDEIFRLPLDTRLAILGPPGTGKTTTLIKRLGQKLDSQYLDEEEHSLIARTIAGQEMHAQSWVMFTPTELLKQYVKEAFARENIPASDFRIQAWGDYRRELARNKLGILRTGVGSGSFVINEELESLQAGTFHRQTDWFTDFESWQDAIFWAELKSHAGRLAENTDASILRLGKRLMEIVDKVETQGRSASFIAILQNVEDSQALVSKLRSDTEATIRRMLSRELQKNRQLLDGMVTFIGTLVETGDDSEDGEAEEEEETRQPRLGREGAFDAYARAVRAHALAQAGRRALGRQSKSAKIIEWLGEHSPRSDELRALGRNFQVQASARRFANPLRRYITELPLRYRRFRRERGGDGVWYADRVIATDLAPIEVDFILLAMLRAANGLLQDNRIRREIEQPRYALLKSISELYRTQVLVDEATDFSPIQLACMANLCDRAVLSFIACGDFNQRVTAWGSRSIEDLKWVFGDIDVRSINITYRHSRQLNGLARRIVLQSTPDAPEAELPRSVDSEGMEPVLGKGLFAPASVAAWLADRIGEIERFTRTLPTIAILVNDEEEVEPIAAALNGALSPQNIRAVACPHGLVVGQENDVRVFDVQHIKGLEFEAVFFLGIDRLAEKEPELFDKYLYVGATRAATYLGLTTTGGSLPPKIRALESEFRDQWS